jgi:hypothetical protein
MDQQTQIKEVIKQEFLKCSQDPSYFMGKYCNIQHPQKGRIPFKLYPFQAKVLKLWKNNRYNIVLKSRQLGISTLAAGYALWLMLFHQDKNILCIATKQETAKNMVSKVKFMFDTLPSWLKIEDVENNRLSIRLKNGSQIKATSAAGDAGRSEAVSLLIIDECAFIDNAAEIWTSAQSTLSTGGSAILLSTPNGVGNFFHKMWSKAELGENDFLPIKLPWDVHPERDTKWRKEQDELLGERMAAQECDCDFSTSGNIVFPPEIISFYESNFIKDPIEKRGVDKNLWIWDYVNYDHQYVVCADVARGDGQDYSAFHVIDIMENRQVVEYRSQIGTIEYAHLLVGISHEYNNALLVVENQNIGWSTIQKIIELGYRNLYYTVKDNSLVDSYFADYESTNSTPGFTNSLKIRPMVIGKLDEYTREKAIIFHSKRLLEEMKTFIWKNGRAEAQYGYHDDLLMSLGIGLFIRDTTLKFNQHNTDMTRAILNNFSVTRQSFTNIYSTKPGNSSYDNPYKTNINGETHDITWLL